MKRILYGSLFSAFSFLVFSNFLLAQGSRCTYDRDCGDPGTYQCVHGMCSSGGVPCVVCPDGSVACGSAPRCSNDGPGRDPRVVTVGSAIRLIRDADLFSGNDVVGQVKKDEVYVIRGISGNWGSFAMLDGSPVNGWCRPNVMTHVELGTIRMDSDLYSGSTVVGHVKAGEKFGMFKALNGWAQLQRGDGTIVDGWIRLERVLITL